MGGIWAVNGSPLGKHARVVTRDTAANTTYDFVIAGGGMAGLTVAGMYIMFLKRICLLCLLRH